MYKKPKNETESVEKLKEIIDTSSHVFDQDDIDFIYSDEARAIRLQYDYIKAESKMQKQGIHHTIVVFGSARIVEFDDAMNRLKIIEEELKHSPHSESLLRTLKKAESMVRKSVYYDEAREFGQLVGKSGEDPKDCHVTLMTGGGPGIMEAANRGAMDVGAKSIGPNPYVSPELSFEFRYFAMRKLHFMQRAKALVVFPGGFGTMDELFEILTLIQTGKSPCIPIVLVGKEYWDRAIDFDFLQEEDVIEFEDLHMIHYVDSAKDAWSAILNWHKKHNTPLF